MTSKSNSTHPSIYTADTNHHSFENTSAYEDMQERGKEILSRKISLFKKNIKSDPSYLEIACNVVLDSYIDELILDIAAEYHCANFQGLSEYMCHESLTSRKDSWSITSSPSHTSKKSKIKLENVLCLNCKKYWGPEKFAVHLDDCMLDGANTKRSSSRRVTRNNKVRFCTRGSD